MTSSNEGSTGKPPTAGVIAPPPLIFASGLAAGWLLDAAIRPLRIPPAVGRVLGLPLLGAGLGLVGLAVRVMLRAGTPIPPNRPTSVLVTDGPFRFTRNPNYLGASLSYAGLSLLLGRLWALLLLPAVLAVIDCGVIVREEAYLERLFGETYRHYRHRVPRWL